ncbi:MAG: glutathione binding-like protein [Myxococcales bacterium]
MIKLFGSPVSTCTRKVLTTLIETETPYEFTLVDLGKGEHKQAAHLTRQPFGQIPAIEDKGFELYESRAICRYLCAKTGSSLVPSDLQRRALMDQWMSVEQSNFSPSAMKFVYHYVFKRNQDEAVLESANKMLDTVYATIAKPLAKSPYLTGDAFTLADIGYMPYIEYMQLSPAKATLEKYPSVVAWWERVSGRPSWKKAIGKA